MATPPFMGNSDLFLHYQRGVINWATYVECASKNASLPFDLQNLPPEPPQQPEPVGPLEGSEEGQRKIPKTTTSTDSNSDFDGEEGEESTLTLKEYKCE